jgi:hypothetical protein
LKKLMTTIASVLRLSCRANGLATSGSSTTLLKRLVGAANKSKSKAPKNKKRAPTNKLKPTIAKPRNTMPFKNVKGGGMRFSASYYFHEMCGGKISRCQPQIILQPDGRRRLKEIRIVSRADRIYPQWVNAA